LNRWGARGEFGFADALDFTVARQPGAQASAWSTPSWRTTRACRWWRCATCCAPKRRAAGSASAPLVQAHESLLHERTPRQIIESADPRALPEPGARPWRRLYQLALARPAAPGWQPTHLLSNGRYSVALRANGAGVSRWRSGDKTNITRWRDDLLRDACGTFIYLRPAGQDRLSSLTAASRAASRLALQGHLPGRPRAVRRGIGAAGGAHHRAGQPRGRHRAAQRHAAQRLRAHAITLDVVSYFEPVLTDPRADEAHPAFSNLFVESRWHAVARAAAVAQARLQGDPAMAAAHFLADSEANVLSIDFMTDRRAFLGRNRGPPSRRCRATAHGQRHAQVNGLDPVAGLRVRMSIPAGGVARLSFATAAAPNTDALMPGIDRYLQPMHVERATRMAATLAQVRLRDLSVATRAENLPRCRTSTTILTYSHAAVMSDRGLIDLRQIWRFGISGDKPIVLVLHPLHERHGAGHTLLRAQPWWGFGGVACDVVVLNSEPNSYLMPLQRDILACATRHAAARRTAFRATTRRLLPAARPGRWCLRRRPRSPAWRAWSSWPTAGRSKCRWRRCTGASAARQRNARPPWPPAGHAARRQAAPSARADRPHRRFDAATGEFRSRSAADPHAAPLGQRDRQRRLRLPGVRSGAPATPGPATAACTRSRPGRTTRCRTRL
jgi:cyclic beta-1,2-glucan synthetase